MSKFGLKGGTGRGLPPSLGDVYVPLLGSQEPETGDFIIEFLDESSGMEIGKKYRVSKLKDPKFWKILAEQAKTAGWEVKE